jgi:uncharacterized protein YuzE
MSTNKNIILAIGTDEKLYTRDNLSAGWIKAPDKGGAVTRVTMMENSVILGIGRDKKLYTRHDLNASWVKAPDKGGAVIDITIIPNGGILGIGTDKKLYTRANLNASWVKAPDKGGQVTALTMMLDGTILAIGTDQKLYTRANLNSNWVKAPDKGGAVTGVTVMPDGSILAIGTDKKLYTRANLNAGWIKAPDKGGAVIDVTSYQLPPAVVPPDENFNILGIGTDNKLYTRKNLNSNWVKAPDRGGRVSDVTTLHDGRILAIGMDKKLYTRDNLEDDWLKAPDKGGAVIGVTVMKDGSILGIGTDKKLYTRVDLDHSWVKAPDKGGAVTGITIMPNGTILGIGTDQKLYTRANLDAGWVKAPDQRGAVIGITIMPNGFIMGIGRDKKLYYRPHLNTGWVKAPDKGGEVIGLTSYEEPDNVVDPDADYDILAVGTDNKLYTRADLEDGWIKAPDRNGKVKGVSIMKDGVILAIGMDNKLYTRNKLRSDWVKAPDKGGAVIGITIMPDGSILGIGTNKKLYTRANLNAAWKKAPDKGGAVTGITIMPDKTILAIGTDKKLYTRATLNTGWVKAPDKGGAVIDVSILRDGTIVGIGTDKKLYTRAGLNAGWVKAPDKGGQVISIESKHSYVLPPPGPVETDNYIDAVHHATSNYFSHLSSTKAYLRLLDTPHVWGMPFGKDIMQQAYTRQAEFERAICEIVQKTKYRCDISSLNSPDPDWVRAIMGAMDTCLTNKIGRTQPTQFRFFFGQTPTVPVGEPTNYSAFKYALIRLFRERSSHWEVKPEIWFGRFYRLEQGILSAIQAKVFGGAIIGSDDTKMTWNHTKIISVDGTEALVGGHNLNMDLFRSYPPVHDVSTVVHGEAAFGPQLFLNQMWVLGTDLFTKEKLNPNNLSWENQDSHRNLPNDPLAQQEAKTYMRAKQQALIAMHESGHQSGEDPPYNSGQQPVPPGIRDQDLQTISDLDLLVFRERIIYNTYEGWTDYKPATRMLTLGKYWDGPSGTTNFKRASEIMKETLIKSAKNIIRMSQMDIVSAWKKNWSDHHVCIWVLEALLANPNLQVQIVVSPLNAGAGAEGDQYSFGSGASRTFALLKYYMTHDVDTDAPLPDPDGKRANALTRLHVAPLYYTDQVPAGSTGEGTTYKWPDLSKEGYTATLMQPPLSQKPPSKGVIGSAAMSVLNASGYYKSKVPSAPGNHAKIMIIDNDVYVIGSDNLYPGFLSEIDYMVEGTDAVNEILTSYWNRLWQYSSPHALTGSGGTMDYALVSINYIKNNNTRTVTWNLNLSWTLLQLKQKMLSDIPADGHASSASQLNVWGPDGMGMQPDIKTLGDFGLKNGDKISVDFPGAGSAFG